MVCNGNFHNITSIVIGVTINLNELTYFCVDNWFNKLVKMILKNGLF
jgi:hypothetical protein